MSGFAVLPLETGADKELGTEDAGAGSGLSVLYLLCHLARATSAAPSQRQLKATGRSGRRGLRVTLALRWDVGRTSLHGHGGTGCSEKGAGISTLGASGSNTLSLSKACDESYPERIYRYIRIHIYGYIALRFGLEFIC